MGAGIKPSMFLTPLPSSIGWGSNPQPSDCEPSALQVDHSFYLTNLCYLETKFNKGFEMLIGDVRLVSCSFSRFIKLIVKKAE